MIDQHFATATLAPLGLSLEVKSSQITLDEGWSPYCQTTFVCVLPEGDDRNAVDLREGELRLQARLRQDFGATFPIATVTDRIGPGFAAITAFLAGESLGKVTRAFYVPWNGTSIRPSGRRNMDLYVSARTFDDVAQELTLTAESDEARLHGDRLNQETVWDPESTSIREIVQLVLARYGAVLDPDALDATVAEVTATIWQPGASAWEYLDPMLLAASLRLWCSEVGVWTISQRQATAPGAVILTPDGSMTGHRDTMTLDPEIWADAVIVEYRWTDDYDLVQVAYDTAGVEVPRAALRVVYRDTRYPGPGAAQGILNRMQGRGRVLDVPAVSDYSVSPGMAATITPPDTETQTGYVSAVTWRLPDALMDVATRGLVDTPETAWLFAPAGVTWSDVPAGMSWLEYTPEGVS